MLPAEHCVPWEEPSGDEPTQQTGALPPFQLKSDIRIQYAHYWYSKSKHPEKKIKLKRKFKLTSSGSDRPLPPENTELLNPSTCLSVLLIYNQH